MLGERREHAKAADAYEEALIFRPDDGMLWYEFGYHRTMATGEFQAAPLLEAIRLSADVLKAAQTDSRWDKWRRPLDELIRRAERILIEEVEAQYQAAIRAIEKAEAAYYASKGLRRYA